MSKRPPFSKAWVRQTIRRLEQLSVVDAEELARHFPELEETFHFLGQVLLDAHEYAETFRKERGEELLADTKACPECGKVLTDVIGREFTWKRGKYCTHRCRQRAYRKRVTARAPIGHGSVTETGDCDACASHGAVQASRRAAP
jgi:hypothetical protein